MRKRRNEEFDGAFCNKYRRFGRNEVQDKTRSTWIAKQRIKELLVLLKTYSTLFCAPQTFHAFEMN